MRYLLLFLPFITACSGLFPDPAPVIPKGTIAPWAENTAYWSWGDDAPVLLLGAGGDDQAFLDPDWRKKMAVLDENGGNYVHLSLSTTDFGLMARKDQTAYADSLAHFIHEAAVRRIVVQLTTEVMPAAKAQTPVIDVSESVRHFKTILEAATYYPNVIHGLRSTYEKGNALLPYEFALEKLNRHRPAPLPLSGRDFYGPSASSNVRQGGENWSELLVNKALNGTLDKRPWNYPDITNHGEQAAEGIAAFNRSLLAGAAAARHAAQPRGDGFTGPALASIRAVRTVEKYFGFWNLEPAPEIIPGVEPNKAYAATDGKNGYLLYLPTAGSVDLELDIQPQVPLRVTVIGYLGTQKSEVLRPPYGDSFTLYTKEPRGGWMVIKPL